MDRYPCTETWNSLSVKEQRQVTSRANKARLPIPEILGLDVRYAEKQHKQEAVQLIAAMRAAVAEVPSYCEREVPHCHLCGETSKTLLRSCQGCKKLVCPRCSLHPAVVLTVCDTCVDAVRQAIANSINAVVERDGGAFDANL